MKKLALIFVAAIALVGCGKKTTSVEPEAEAEPKADEKKQEPPQTVVIQPEPPKTFINSLGMVFKPVPGTDVQFCIWETRVKDYAVFAAANTGVDGKWENFEFGGLKQTEPHPVLMVNWNDAQAFCAWLTQKELAEEKIKPRQKYRLPTDAEWSVAVGLGQEKGDSPMAKDEGIRGVYPWGKEWPPPKGAGNYDESLNVDKYESTAPGGSFASNKFGLHGLGGNVYEWCEDNFNPTDKRRVLRGMSWGYFGSPNYLLSAFRFPETPDLRKIYFGFRCVLENE